MNSIGFQWAGAIQGADCHLQSPVQRRTRPFGGSPIVSAYFTRSVKVHMYQVLSIKLCLQMGSKRYAFSIKAPILWNSIPLEILMVLTLLAFVRPGCFLVGLGQDVIVALIIGCCCFLLIIRWNYLLRHLPHDILIYCSWMFFLLIEFFEVVLISC